ncbi:peptidoglycan-recognition protein SC2-like isoform X2 [Ostrea edulis]|nr:peptidoglycan-recognition protein SC2-like isoform X2 [Ostrea edulis]XP_056006495.1 peptidoglycan-recognition protein SC2-like isoform X2 [Ostrea edulis]XP_056006496.1 peptidoglycan-recognition protein SC2-like isoform X2 [Ostrea edulis]
MLGGACQNDHKTFEEYYDLGGGVKIYSRKSWEARAPKQFQSFQKPASFFFIHHTDGSLCYEFHSCVTTLKEIQHFHMDTRGWDDIGYSFLVGQDGNIYEGRGWDHVGAHTLHYNTSGYAASFMGNFMTHPPNDASLTAVKKLIDYGISQGYIAATYKLYGHRDVGNTACPGDALYPIIQTWPHYTHTKPENSLLKLT